MCLFFFKQKTAYEMRISDWSSDVCSSDLLDDILSGGLTRGRVFLLEGSPGTGKTTIATQFLIEGARRGERCLYITLSETEEEMRESAASHGWTLEGVDLFELVPPESLLDEQQIGRAHV